MHCILYCLWTCICKAHAPPIMCTRQKSFELAQTASIFSCSVNNDILFWVCWITHQKMTLKMFNSYEQMHAGQKGKSMHKCQDVSKSSIWHWKCVIIWNNGRNNMHRIKWHDPRTKRRWEERKKGTESKLWPHVSSSPIRICECGWPRQQGSSVLFYHKHFRIPIIQSDRTRQQVEYHYPSTPLYYGEHILPI